MIEARLRLAKHRAFLGLMRNRGLECHRAGHVEAFSCRKVVLAGAG
jgi:hypothetical protein